MSKIRIDVSNFPYIMVTMPEDKPQVETVEKAYESLKRILENKKPFVLIFDTSKSEFMAKEMIEYYRKWLQANKTLVKDVLLGTAFYVTSASVRLLLKTNNFFKRNIAPETIQPSYEEAYLWADRQVERYEDN